MYTAASTNNNRVVEYKPPFSNGMNAALVLGQANFTSNTTATTQNGMVRPTAVAFDSSGNLYVPDSGNCRTLVFASPFTTGMNATVVLGQSSFTTGACAVTATGQNDVFGVATGP